MSAPVQAATEERIYSPSSYLTCWSRIPAIPPVWHAPVGLKWVLVWCRCGRCKNKGPDAWIVSCSIKRDGASHFQVCFLRRTCPWKSDPKEDRGLSKEQANECASLEIILGIRHPWKFSVLCRILWILAIGTGPSLTLRSAPCEWWRLTETLWREQAFVTILHVLSRLSGHFSHHLVGCGTGKNREPL